MRIDWTEPLSKCLVRHRFGEARREAVSVMRLIGGCSVLAGLVCIAVRIMFPETSEVLSWYRILHTAIVMPAAALLLLFLSVVFPLCVHITEKGIMFQMGSGGTFVKYDQIDTLSFVESDGLRMFKVSFKTKKGALVTRLAAASPKIREEEVGKFLADIGQEHRVHLQR